MQPSSLSLTYGMQTSLPQVALLPKPMEFRDKSPSLIPSHSTCAALRSPYAIRSRCVLLSVITRRK